MAADGPAAAVAYCAGCDFGFCLEHLIEHDPRCTRRGEAARPDPNSPFLSNPGVPCAVCAGVLLPDARPLHERLNCLGFFGFGSGYADAVGWRSGDGGLYCNGCPLALPCWEKHKDRCRRVFPTLMAAWDRFVAKHGGGPETLGRFLAAQAAEGIQRPGEATTAVMGGNVLDGRDAAVYGRVAQRGDGTLPWPFPPAGKAAVPS